MNERGSVQPFGSDNRGKGLKENEQSVTVADNEMEDVDFEDEC